MGIKVWNYLAEYDAERADILDAVDTVFRSGQLILGQRVGDFERAFADYHGVPHCAGVDNGTNALVLALRALGVGRGDEVITVANTAAPTVVAIDAVGATPVFVDVHPETYLMDVDRVPDVITERTKCLLPVHLYGQCVDLAALTEHAAAYGLAVLEDCAQAHGARRHALEHGHDLAGAVLTDPYRLPDAIRSASGRPRRRSMLQTPKAGPRARTAKAQRHVRRSMRSMARRGVKAPPQSITSNTWARPRSSSSARVSGRSTSSLRWWLPRSRRIPTPDAHVMAAERAEGTAATSKGRTEPMLIPLLAQIPAHAVSADEVLSPYIYVFYAAFIVSFIFTPVRRCKKLPSASAPTASMQASAPRPSVSSITRATASSVPLFTTMSAQRDMGGQRLTFACTEALRLARAYLDGGAGARIALRDVVLEDLDELGDQAIATKGAIELAIDEDRRDGLLERAEPLRDAAGRRDDHDHDDVRLEEQHLDVAHGRRLERRPTRPRALECLALGRRCTRRCPWTGSRGHSTRGLPHAPLRRPR